MSRWRPGSPRTRRPTVRVAAAPRPGHQHDPGAAEPRRSEPARRATTSAQEGAPGSQPEPMAWRRRQPHDPRTPRSPSRLRSRPTLPRARASDPVTILWTQSGVRSPCRPWHPGMTRRLLWLRSSERMRWIPGLPAPRRAQSRTPQAGIGAMRAAGRTGASECPDSPATTRSH